MGVAFKCQLSFQIFLVQVGMGTGMFFLVLFLFLLCMHHSEMCGSLCFLCYFTRPYIRCLRRSGAHKASTVAFGGVLSFAALIRLDVQELRCTAVWIQGWRPWCLPAREWRGGRGVVPLSASAFVCIMHFLLWLNEDLNNLGHYLNILGFLLKELAAVPEVEQNTLSVLLLFTCCRVNGPLCNSK